MYGDLLRTSLLQILLPLCCTWILILRFHEEVGQFPEAMGVLERFGFAHNEAAGYTQIEGDIDTEVIRSVLHCIRQWIPYLQEVEYREKELNEGDESDTSDEGGEG